RPRLLLGRISGQGHTDRPDRNAARTKIPTRLLNALSAVERVLLQQSPPSEQEDRSHPGRPIDAAFVRPVLSPEPPGLTVIYRSFNRLAIYCILPDYREFVSIDCGARGDDRVYET